MHLAQNPGHVTLGGPPGRGPNAIATLANVTRRDLDMFHENANIYALGGVDARHSETKMRQSKDWNSYVGS